MRADACGGRCFAVGRRWRAATAWRNFARPRRARSATCGVTPRTCRRRWRPRFPPVSSANRAAGRSRWPGWRPCSARPRAAGKRRWPIAWPERPAHGPLDDHRAEGPPLEPHSALAGRRSLLFGGGGRGFLAGLQGSVDRAGRRRGQGASGQSGSPGSRRARRQITNRPIPHPQSAHPLIRPWFRQRTSSRYSRRKISCFRPTNRYKLPRSTCAPANVFAAHRAAGRWCWFRSLGLIVDKDDVRFENIDFVWDHASGVDPTKSGRAGDGATASQPGGRFAAVRFDVRKAGERAGIARPLPPSAGCIRHEPTSGNVAAQRPDRVGRLSAAPRRRGNRLPDDRSGRHRIDKHAAPSAPGRWCGWTTVRRRTSRCRWACRRSRCAAADRCWNAVCRAAKISRAKSRFCRRRACSRRRRASRWCG